MNVNATAVNKTTVCCSRDVENFAAPLERKSARQRDSRRFEGYRSWRSPCTVFIDFYRDIDSLHDEQSLPTTSASYLCTYINSYRIMSQELCYLISREIHYLLFLLYYFYFSWWLSIMFTYNIFTIQKFIYTTIVYALHLIFFFLEISIIWFSNWGN